MMSKRDSIRQNLTQALTWILALVGSRYPALANYRMLFLERHKLRHMAVAAVVLILGYLSHRLPESIPWTAWIVAFVVVAEIALLWLEYLALARSRDRNLRIKDISADLLEEVRRASLPPSYSFEKIGDGAIIRSDAVDRWLQTRPNIPLELQRAGTEKRILKYNEPYLLESFDYLITRLHGSGKRFFNEKKISLRTELNADQLVKAQRAVTIGKTSYIAGALTNDACVNQLIRSDYASEVVYANLAEMYPLSVRDGHAHFLSLDDSQLSNHLGASTIALFRETNGTCVVVVPRQGKMAARSAGLLAPTGSGSLDWADLEDLSSPDLLTLIARGANRELCEEQGFVGLGRGVRALDDFLKRHAVETYVLGYYRWLNFGGLPQFCCISTVRGINVEDLRPDQRELGPYALSGGQRFEKRAITSARELAVYCDDLLAQPLRLSIPLAVNLGLLSSLIRDESASVGHVELIKMIDKLLIG
jgi:hypothetical protein